MRILFIALICGICLSVFAVEGKDSKKEVKTKNTITEKEIQKLIVREAKIDVVIKKFGKPHHYTKTYRRTKREDADITLMVVRKICQWNFDDGSTYTLEFGREDELLFMKKDSINYTK